MAAVIYIIATIFLKGAENQEEANINNSNH